MIELMPLFMVVFSLLRNGPMTVRQRNKPVLDRQTATAAVVLDAIAEHCLVAHQLSRENHLGVISDALELVLLQVGKRLGQLEHDQRAEIDTDDRSSATIHES